MGTGICKGGPLPPSLHQGQRGLCFFLYICLNLTSNNHPLVAPSSLFSITLFCTWTITDFQPWLTSCSFSYSFFLRLFFSITNYIISCHQSPKKKNLLVQSTKKLRKSNWPGLFLRYDRVYMSLADLEFLYHGLTCGLDIFRSFCYKEIRREMTWYCKTHHHFVKSICCCSKLPLMYWLKQYKLSYKFYTLEFWHTCHQAKNQGSIWLHSFLEALEDPVLCLFGLLREVSSMWLQNGGPCFLLSCQVRTDPSL